MFIFYVPTNSNQIKYNIMSNDYVEYFIIIILHINYYVFVLLFLSLIFNNKFTLENKTNRIRNS